MSSRVYVDGRIVQLGNCEAIVQQAMQDLRARRSNITCGRADVVASNLSVADQNRVFNEARYQDKMDTRDTRGLEGKLNAEVADYSAMVLPDWKPLPGEAIEVFETGGPSVGGMRLVEDFECDEMKVEDDETGVHSARMMVFEVTDGLGNSSYQIGLDSLLFDDDMEWKDKKNKEVYEKFATGVLRAAKHALKDGDASAGGGALARKLAKGGFTKKGEETIPGGTHSIYSRSPGADAGSTNTQTLSATKKPGE
jgi:hypothetical protein